MALPSGKPRSSVPAGPGKRSRMLGRYHVLDEIGHNAVGPLYLARLEGPKGFQRWAAIRRVNRVHLPEPGYVQRFYERVREGAKLLHPNVTALFDVDEEEGTPWVAMEYLHGERVEEAIERLEMADTPVSWEIALRIISDAAEGLHAVHSLRDKENKPLGLLHGDLAPHSLVITYEGKTKIKGAFEPRAHGVLDPRKTPYAAPEQLFDGVVDARADVFALGVLLWELLTGKRLFSRKSDDETRAMIEAGVVPPLADLVAEVPTELDALVRHALVRNPTQRFPSARELSRELESLLVAKGMVARDDDVGRYMRTLFADRYVEQEARLQAAADVTEVFRKSRVATPAAQKSGSVAVAAVAVAIPDLSNTHDAEDDPEEETELMRSPLASVPPSESDEDRTTAERRAVTAPFAAPTERDMAPPTGLGYTDELPSDSGPTLPKRPVPIPTRPQLADSDEVPTAQVDKSRITRPPPPPPPPPTSRASRPPPPSFAPPPPSPPPHSRADEPTLTAQTLTQPLTGGAPTPVMTPAVGGRQLIMPEKLASDADITESAIFVAPRMPSNTPSPDPNLPPRPTTPSFPDRPLLPATPPTGVERMQRNLPTGPMTSPLQQPPTAPREMRAPPAGYGAFPVPNAFARQGERTTSRGPHAALTTGPLRAILFPQDRAKRVAIVSVVGFAGGALLFVVFFVLWRLLQGTGTAPAPTLTQTAPPISRTGTPAPTHVDVGTTAAVAPGTTAPGTTAPAATTPTTTAPPSPPPIPTMDLTPTPHTPIPHHHATTHTTPPVVTSPPAPASGKTGFLTVMCRPVACDHVVDGSRDLGSSPLYREEISAGKHRLVLRVEKTHAEKVVSVDVPDGENVTIHPDVQ